MTRSLAGKVAIVTGASQGLGLEISRKYIAAGASLMICARDKSMVEEARRELEAAIGPDQRVLALAADVSRQEDSSAVVGETLSALGRIDILVNNAGVY